jgi:myo-inositol-1(or 4)-monophosphatase
MATLPDTDWLAVCRRACDGVRAAMARFPSPAERAVPTGRGEGGDIALVIDRAAEDAIFAELEALGLPLTVVSEERGHVDLNGGGQTRLIVDPIDGSRNAKRGIPAYSVSIAVADGPTTGDVVFGYVYDLALDEEWHAARGDGAWLGDSRLPALPAAGELEMLGMEMVEPTRLLDAARAIEETGAGRLRALGSLALSLCWVAAGRLDGMVSLSKGRSVDFAAGQLIVLEAGGSIAIPDAGGDVASTSMDLDVRTRVIAGANDTLLDRLLPVGQT